MLVTTVTILGMTGGEPFRESIGASIGRAAKMMGKMLNDHLNEEGLDIHVEHFVVLKHLYEKDGQTQQELGNTAGKDKTSVTRAINGLESKNLVLRVPDQLDRRNKRVYLTQKGKDIKEQLLGPALKTTQLATKNISAEELEICNRVLSKIYDNLSNKP